MTVVQSEAQKRAKAKYYQKLKENRECKEEATINEQRNIIYINNKGSILKTVNNIMQKTKKSFYNIQRIRKETKN